MKILALDVGERRTGVAFFDPAIDFVIPLDTLHHSDEGELVDMAEAVLHRRGVTHVVIGLPLLLGGTEGSQARFAKLVGTQLQARGFEVSYVDERFTTDRAYPGDGDAKAACIVLNTYREHDRSRGIDN